MTAPRAALALAALLAGCGIKAPPRPPGAPEPAPSPAPAPPQAQPVPGAAPATDRAP